ncbi:MAG: hypothetical protein OXI87_23630 [Albidovulum sp.]|nr:hypothetical protein [Albidovulum sp.]MDE0533601.1 hypothetical protein [Albidovulum sp.]
MSNSFIGATPPVSFGAAQAGCGSSRMHRSAMSAVIATMLFRPSLRKPNGQTFNVLMVQRDIAELEIVTNQFRTLKASGNRQNDRIKSPKRLIPLNPD